MSVESQSPCPSRHRCPRGSGRRGNQAHQSPGHPRKPSPRKLPRGRSWLRRRLHQVTFCAGRPEGAPVITRLQGTAGFVVCLGDERILPTSRSARTSQQTCPPWNLAAIPHSCSVPSGRGQRVSVGSCLGSWSPPASHLAFPGRRTFRGSFLECEFPIWQVAFWEQSLPSQCHLSALWTHYQWVP
jgi:hypothetical protein